MTSISWLKEDFESIKSIMIGLEKKEENMLEPCYGFDLKKKDHSGSQIRPYEFDASEYN